MKSLLELTLDERKKYLPKKDDWIECRKCGSEKLSYQKFLGHGKIMGDVYHYKAICLKCGTKYHVKRNKYVFDKVKEQEWIKTPSYKKK